MVFVLDDGWMYAVGDVVSGQVRVRRLDGSTVEAQVRAVQPYPDGKTSVTLAVPGGIDRAPREEPQ